MPDTGTSPCISFVFQPHYLHKMVYYTSLIFSSWFRILIGLEHGTCKVQGNILLCYLVMLHWQVMLHFWRHLPFAAHASSSGVIKRSKRFSIESGQSEINICFSTQADQRFRFLYEKNCVLSFSIYRDWSRYGDAQVIYRLHTVSVLTFLLSSSFYSFICGA